jgi:SAM-dependent methyltransferase
MWRWYQTQLQELGVAEATVLLCRVLLSRVLVNLANAFMRARVWCPCCGWKGRRFYSYIEAGYSVPNAACPNCDSHPRHRRFFLWLNNEYLLKDRRGVGVIFAPEKSLRPIWDNLPYLRIFRVDFCPARGVDFLVDIQRLPLADDSVDFLWCHHVLEHIENDGSAMSELNRVLRSGTGELIVSVPMLPDSLTKEYGYANLKESGHWRLYGDDFVDRLATAGFSVRAIDYTPPGTDARKIGLTPELFYLCSKPVPSGSQT